MELINYVLVLIFGLYLTVWIACGVRGDRRQKRAIRILCAVLLVAQGICCGIAGVELTQKLYPFIVHLPALLVMIFALKVRIDMAVVSMCIAYLCCQFAVWVQFVIGGVTHSELSGQIAYTVSLTVSGCLLQRYFVRPAHDALMYTPRSLFLFGSLPVAYYIFDYATTVYSQALYEGTQALNELLPTIVIIFYVMFLTAYHEQMRRRMEIGTQKSVLEAKLRQSKAEMDGLRSIEAKTMVYRHDMRHNLNMIDGFLETDRPDKAREFIRTIMNDLESIKPRRLCDNDTVNLLCLSFSEKAERIGARLELKFELPKELALLDTELCAVISNGLENALNAVSDLDEKSKWISFYCGVRRNKLLIEIRNPYSGEITMRNGVPVSERKEHGYGCRSIRSIAEQKHGMYSFAQEEGVFILRVVLPLDAEPAEG